MKRLPDYLKRPIINTETTKTVRNILKNHCLNTVCENARCPNKNECYTKHTATFLIMGNVCTRNCRYCNISSGIPEELNENEPKEIANAIKELGLKYAVITSVTRDDIPDGGADHFAKTIEEIRKISPNTKIEILTPDFNGDKNSLDIIIKTMPEVFNHNIETVPSLYKHVRQMANYQRSLTILKESKNFRQDIKTKSGMMLGLGETKEEVLKTMDDLLENNVDILTLGQYLQPTSMQVSVKEFITPKMFNEYKEIGLKKGFKFVESSPFTRSSYNARNHI